LALLPATLAHVGLELWYSQFYPWWAS
jgi:hypothetical protein